MLAQVGGEPCPQQRFGGRIKLVITHHFANCLYGLDEGAAYRTKITAFTFDGHHAGHVTEEVGKEAKIEPLFSDVEGAMAQFIKRQVLKNFTHGPDPIWAPLVSSWSSGNRQICSSHNATATRRSDPMAVPAAAHRVS